MVNFRLIGIVVDRYNSSSSGLDKFHIRRRQVQTITSVLSHAVWTRLRENTDDWPIIFDNLECIPRSSSIKAQVAP